MKLFKPGTICIKLFHIVFIASSLNILFSCFNHRKGLMIPSFQYHVFKDSLLRNNHTLPDSINIFDKSIFIPGRDSLDSLLISVDTFLKQLKQQDLLTATEKSAVMENLKMIDSFFQRKDTTPGNCSENECSIYAHVIKSRQILYLFFDGKLVDSFPVSTGMKGYTTPDMNVRPTGPVFTRYTSRKFPGGNYKGLGNMPYAVFVKGGYAIHGTTSGNFSRLGHIASHGCIRLHPDNARVFYELVKLFGLKNTWVKVSG